MRETALSLSTMLRPNAAARKTPTWPTPTREQVEVLLLGTYHMEEPGLDQVNPETDDDVLGERRQREIEALVSHLKAAAPDTVAVERPAARAEAVNELYEDPPTSTEQVIHPEAYPDDSPTDVSVTDRSSGDWEQVTRRASTTGTFGEATLYAMLWHNGVIPSDHVESDDRRWNYSHPLTTGWEGDAFVPYSDGSSAGYVFKSTWENGDEAAAFHGAYVDLLTSKGATEVSEGVYRVPDDSGFGDAFRVELDGDTVIVTNAPTVEELDDVREEN